MFLTYVKKYTCMEWTAIAWYLPKGSASKKVTLHNRLFGCHSGGYYYDGILHGWKSRKRVVLVEYRKLKNALIAVKDPRVTEQVKTVLRELAVDFRTFPYNPDSNFFEFHSRRLTSLNMKKE